MISDSTIALLSLKGLFAKNEFVQLLNDFSFMNNNPFIPSDYQSLRVANSRFERNIAKAMLMIRVGTPVDQIKAEKVGFESFFAGLQSQEYYDKILASDIDGVDKKSIAELINNRHEYWPKLKSAFHEFQKRENIANLHYQTIVKKVARFNLTDQGKEDWFNLCMYSLDILDQLVIRDKKLLTSEWLFDWLVDCLASWNEFQTVLQRHATIYREDDETLTNIQGLVVRKNDLLGLQGQVIRSEMAQKAACEVYLGLIRELASLAQNAVNDRLVHKVGMQVFGLHQYLTRHSEWVRDYQPQRPRRQRIEEMSERMRLVEEGLKKQEQDPDFDLVTWLESQLGLRKRQIYDVIKRYRETHTQ